MLSIILLSSLALTAAPAASAASPNSQTDRIYVLNNNMENRHCTYRWKWLLKSVKNKRVYYPDVITLQQVRNQEDLEVVKDLLQSRWGVEYDGEIAHDIPLTSKNRENFDLTDDCVEGAGSKGVQTNAVLWRVDRFERRGSKTTWDSDGTIKNKSTGAWSGCRNLAEDFPSQLRARNVAVALRDTVAKENLVVASVHWPKKQSSGDTYYDKFKAHPCVTENMREADEALDRLIDRNHFATKTTRIIAGDMNAKTSIDDWWKYATKTLKYTDPIAAVCGQTDGDDPTKCSGTGDGRNTKHRTTAKNRIDYILLKHGSSTGKATTIDQPGSGKLYSNHRAVWAPVKY